MVMPNALPRITKEPSADDGRTDSRRHARPDQLEQAGEVAVAEQREESDDTDLRDCNGAGGLDEVAQPLSAADDDYASHAAEQDVGRELDACR